MKISKREQAKAKKNKQGKKKGLANFFGQEPCVPAPPREGTPINAVVQQRENRGTDREEGKGKSPLTELASLKRLTKVKAMRHLNAEDEGERVQGDGQTLLKKSTKKLSRNGSDDEISCRSKRTKSDDKGSALMGSNPTAPG
jgi:Ulp1 family protease